MQKIQHLKEKNLLRKKKTLLGFVDVEGQGADQDEKYDTLLALPLLLTGKVVLFNHKGAPTVHAMLSRLGVIARAAEFVTTLANNGADEGDMDEDEGDGYEKPKTFGHLHVCFRDFSFRGTTDDVLDQLLQDENVPKRSMKQDNNKIQAITERNEIRSLLKKNFESINVNLFKQPANPDQLKEHAELPEELIDVEFSNTLDELRDSIIEQTKEPRLFNGVILTGSRLAGILSNIVNIVNSGVDVNVPSVFRAMEQENVRKVQKMIIDEFTKLIKEFELPLSEAEHDKHIAVAKEKVIKIYDAKLITCTLQDEVEKGKEGFNKKSVDIIDRAKKENLDACWAYAKEMVLSEVQTLKKDYEVWCQERIPSEDTQIFQSRYSEMQLNAAKSLAGKLRHLPHILGDPKFESLMKIEQEKVDVVVQVQVAKNQAELNEAMVQKIIAETEEMRRKHQETQEKLLKKISETSDKANQELQAFSQQQTELYSEKLGTARHKQKQREKKLIERAEELLDIKRQNATKISQLESELTHKERGYLEKRGNRHQKFQVRWFELVKPTGSRYSELRYFGKQEDSRCKGSILLDQRINIDYVNNARDFCIHAPKRDYNLRASNTSDAYAWVKTLRELTNQQV